MATISTRSASLVRKSESGTREGAKTDARLEEEEASIATSIRSVLFIYRCLPTCASYRPQHSANRRLRATATRNATSNRIGPFLPSFLTDSTRCRGARPYSGCPKWPPQGRANWPSRIHSKSSANNSRPPDRFATNDFGEFFEYESEGTILRGENSNTKRTSWRSDPRSIDPSIDPSTNRPSKPAKPTALYFALEKYPVSRIEQKRLLSLGERPRSVIINDPIHRLGFASHWFVTRARVSPRVEKFFARCVPNISVRSSIVAR